MFILFWLIGSVLAYVYFRYKKRAEVYTTQHRLINVVLSVTLSWVFLIGTYICYMPENKAAKW